MVVTVKVPAVPAVKRGVGGRGDRRWLASTVRVKDWWRRVPMPLRR